MNGRDVDIVVDSYLFLSFILNCLLSGLGYDFGTISVIKLTVSPNYLAGDSAIMICFFSEWLFAWINFMNR